MNLEEWLEAPAERFLNAWRRNLIAILTTFILNLLVAIGLLLLNLQGTAYPAEGQVLVSLESEAEPPEADKQPAQEPKSWRQEFNPLDWRMRSRSMPSRSTSQRPACELRWWLIVRSASRDPWEVT